MNHSWSEQCTPIQELIPDVLDIGLVQGIFGVLYLFVFGSGWIGNVLVAYAMSCKGIQFSVRGLFIWSLTLSNILVCFTALPLTAIHTFTRTWNFGRMACQTVPLLMGASVFINSFTLMTIAWDRYLILVCPKSREMTYQRAIGTILAVWTIGFIASIPYGVFMELQTDVIYNGTLLCGSFCEEGWSDFTARRMYGSVVLMLQFALPLLFCTWCYAAISRHLETNYRKRMSYESLSLQVQTRMRRRRWRVNRMIAYMLFSFIGAWLPLNVLNALRDFQTFSSDAMFSIAFSVTHVIAMTTVVWNPIIYSFCNETFRGAINPAKRCNPAKSQWPLSEAVPKHRRASLLQQQPPPKFLIAMFQGHQGSVLHTVNALAQHLRCVSSSVNNSIKAAASPQVVIDPLSSGEFENASVDLLDDTVSQVPSSVNSCYRHSMVSENTTHRRYDELFL